MKTPDRSLFLINLVQSLETYYQRNADASVFLKAWNKIQTRLFAEHSKRLLVSVSSRSTKLTYLG